ncbi:MAG: hypothetical protein ACI906_005392, partial [Candidatus Latescibacterota bacterium]
MNTRSFLYALAALWLVGSFSTASAQNGGTRLGDIKRGGRVDFSPKGPGVLFDALDPAVKKWYVPQELYNEYRWKQ